MLHLLYSAITRWRRAHAEPRRLGRPVISVGNLAVGGRAKTPMAEHVARALLAAGEQPAILSRGYARGRNVDQPVVVRDAESVRASIAESGDEPLMLAERLDGAIVVVSADRARAGAVAEGLGATVHVLDDGFQHLRVARDIDLVMLDARDLRDAVLPGGRLREPLDALDHADVIVVTADAAEERAGAAGAVREIPGAQVFTAARRTAPPPPDLTAESAFLVSALAGNAQFVDAVRAAGWRVAGTAGFKDHHRYSSADASGIAAKAATAGAAFCLTTAKDAVRLREVWRADLPLHVAELTIAFDEPGALDRWLVERVAAVRRERADAERLRRQDGARRAS